MINVQGINIDNIQTIINELLNLSCEATQKLNDIEILINDSREYFKGDCEQLYIDKFNTLATNFPIVKNNIISYAEELNRLTNNYKLQIDTLNLTIKKDTHHIDVEI